MSGTHSYLLKEGPYESLEVQEAFINVDTSSVWETGPSDAVVHLSYWLPSNTLDAEKVPVIAIVSPYFDYGGPDGDASTPTNIVGAARGELSLKTLFPGVMHLHKSLYLVLKNQQDALITEVTESS